MELGVAERKVRERAEREQRITAAARQIAAREGWGAVTIRRLADEIEYSQPVLYGHFENRDAIVTAVALQGFEEIAGALEHAVDGITDRHEALRSVALAYLDFARAHGALYEAMFTMPTRLRFATAETPPELQRGFAALASVVGPLDGKGELATETFWAALHGLAELDRSGRIRAGARHDRIAFLIDRLLGR